MESLSGNQVKDLKELYKGIYDQTIDETTANLQKLDKKSLEAMKGKSINITLPDGSTKKVYQGSDEYRKALNNKNNKVEKKKFTPANEIKDKELLNKLKNTSLYKSRASNPENFQSVEKQKEYLKVLNNKDVNPAEIDKSKYLKNNEVKKGEVKPKVKEKPLLSKPIKLKTDLGSDIRQVKPSSARDKMIAKNEIKLGDDRINLLRKQNADFQSMKKGDITKAAFMKQYPNSQTTKKFKMKALESYEPYDLVLDYVLSEGHADNIEEAHYVMIQMDAETIQDIVEKTGIFQDPKLNKMYPNQPEMTEKGEQILPNLPDPTIVKNNKVINPKKRPRVFGDPTGELTKDFFK